MSWTDKISLQTINQLRDEFGIKNFIETGTYKGTNALVQAQNFNYVYTCEIDKEYYRLANIKLKDEPYVYTEKISSPLFLERMRKKFVQRKILNTPLMKSIKKTVFIYLDAHFYDTTLPKNKTFVVLDELSALENFPNCIICIHDFDNGEFGHITYDGQSLNFDLLKEKLKNVNKNFHYYTNTKCDIIRMGKEIGLEDDQEMMDTLRFVWSSREKSHRGILYCVPWELDLTKYKLREIDGT